ncbi:hypothetical protein J4425_00515 [Candidatus Woesearchaeota archaeon]|nr:hypothetical protein [Candidatus Woesearchaeota archaeon]
MDEKEMVIKFRVINGSIQTQIHTKNINSQEAIGLLETAKDQMMEGVRKNRKEVFKSSKKNE